MKVEIFIHSKSQRPDDKPVCFKKVFNWPDSTEVPNGQLILKSEEDTGGELVVGVITYAKKGKKNFAEIWMETVSPIEDLREIIDDRNGWQETILPPKR